MRRDGAVWGVLTTTADVGKALQVTKRYPSLMCSLSKAQWTWEEGGDRVGSVSPPSALHHRISGLWAPDKRRDPGRSGGEAHPSLCLRGEGGAGDPLPWA